VLVLVEFRSHARLLGFLPIDRLGRALCAAFGRGVPPNPATQNMAAQGLGRAIGTGVTRRSKTRASAHPQDRINQRHGNDVGWGRHCTNF
jgi:hypothetical protein